MGAAGLPRRHIEIENTCIVGPRLRIFVDASGLTWRRLRRAALQTRSMHLDDARPTLHTETTRHSSDPVCASTRLCPRRGIVEDSERPASEWRDIAGVRKLKLSEVSTTHGSRERALRAQRSLHARFFNAPCLSRRSLGRLGRYSQFHAGLVYTGLAPQNYGLPPLGC